MSISLLYGYSDYALEILHVAGDVFAPDERVAIDRQLRANGGPGSVASDFPGRRQLAAMFHRLWKLCLPRDDAWSVSDAEIGNLG
jgi:hypothetical protein